METRQTRNAIAASINELAAYIRQEGPVSFGQVCVKMHIAPSTLYGWKKILLDMCKDVRYSHGVFSVERPLVQTPEAEPIPSKGN